MVIISTCYLALIMIKCLHKNKTFVQEHNFGLLRHFPESQSSVLHLVKIFNHISIR